MNRGWYKFPVYLAIAPDKKIYKINSWVSIVGWLEIPSTDSRFYSKEGEILPQYNSKDYYTKYRGKITMKPR